MPSSSGLGLVRRHPLFRQSVVLGSVVGVQFAFVGVEPAAAWELSRRGSAPGRMGRETSCVPAPSTGAGPGGAGSAKDRPAATMSSARPAGASAVTWRSAGAWISDCVPATDATNDACGATRFVDGDATVGASVGNDAHARGTGTASRRGAKSEAVIGAAPGDTADVDDGDAALPVASLRLRKGQGTAGLRHCSLIRTWIRPISSIKRCRTGCSMSRIVSKVQWK